MGVWAKVPWIATTSNLSIRTDKRWNRKALSQWSLDTWEIRFPRSLRISIPALLIGPRVSTATGTNVYDCASCPYLAIFLSTVASAAALGTLLKSFQIVFHILRFHRNVLSGTLWGISTRTSSSSSKIAISVQCLFHRSPHKHAQIILHSTYIVFVVMWSLDPEVSQCSAN